MSQKTITINGQKFTGKQIADIMDNSKVTDDSGLVKFVKLAGIEYTAEYRHDDHDGYMAPITARRSNADFVKIECRTYQESAKWIEL